jgi:hypothetical protein
MGRRAMSDHKTVGELFRDAWKSNLEETIRQLKDIELLRSSTEAGAFSPTVKPTVKPTK